MASQNADNFFTKFSLVIAKKSMLRRGLRAHKEEQLSERRSPLARPAHRHSVSAAKASRSKRERLSPSPVH